SPVDALPDRATPQVVADTGVNHGGQVRVGRERGNRPRNRCDILPRGAAVGALEQTRDGSGVNRLRPGSIYGKRYHGVIGETRVDDGPSISTINGFSDAASSCAHENSSGVVRVDSDGLDSDGAGADVGPRAIILLGDQQKWRKKHTDNNGCGSHGATLPSQMGRAQVSERSKTV